MVGSPSYRAFLPHISFALVSVSSLKPLLLTAYLRRLRTALTAHSLPAGGVSAPASTVAQVLLAPFLPQYWWVTVYVLALRLVLLVLYTFVPQSSTFTA